MSEPAQPIIAPPRNSLGASVGMVIGTESEPVSIIRTLALLINGVAAAPLVGPAFSGTPLAPTASPGTNTTQIATTAFVTAAVANLGAGTITISMIGSASRTGTAAKLVTGTAGSNGHIAAWNATGDLVTTARSLSGIGASVITGAAGSAGHVAMWNATGDLVTTARALSGADPHIVTGTAGANGQFANWNGDGDLVGIALTLSGLATKLITGTPGTTGRVAMWNVNGDLVTTGATLSGSASTIITGVIGTANRLLMSNGTDAVTADGATLGGTYSFGGTVTLTGATVNLPTGAVDAITEIASGLRTGTAAKLATGTAGTNGNLAAWNANGDVVDGGAPGAVATTVSVTQRILARKTAGAGPAEECTLSEILEFIGSAARGDVLVRGASTWSRLAIGAAGTSLQSDGTDPAWSAIPPEAATATQASTTPTVSRSAYRDKYTRLTGTGNKTLTFENEVTSGWVAGDTCYFRMAGTGTMTLAGSGVSFAGATASFAQHTTFAVRYVGSNAWDVI